MTKTVKNILMHFVLLTIKRTSIGKMIKKEDCQVKLKGNGTTKLLVSPLKMKLKYKPFVHTMGLRMTCISIAHANKHLILTQ